jgi:hypothetical protein
MSTPAAPIAAPATPTPAPGGRAEAIISDGKKARKDSIKGIFAEMEETPAADIISNPPPPNTDPNPQPVPPSEPAPAKPAAEIQIPGIEDDDDFNQRPVVPAAKKPDEPEKVEDREERSIATLREQLGIQGRRAKELEVSVTERDLQLRAKDEEIARLTAELNSPSRAAQNPMAVKDIRDIADSLNKDAKTNAAIIGGRGGAAFAQNFESLLRQHANIANAENETMRDQLVEELREKIGTTIGDDEVKDVMRWLAERSDRYVDMRRLIDNVGTLAEEEEIKSKVSSWDEFKNKGFSSIASIADVDDEFIEANPHSPQSFVAKMVKSDPAYKLRSDKVKQAVVEAFNGKRPLTRDEMTRLKENEEVSGVKISDFLKERGKREEANRSEMMKRAYLATMLLPELSDILADSAKIRQNESAKEKERLALLSGTSDRSAPATPPGEITKASERPSAVRDVLSAMRQ